MSDNDRTMTDLQGPWPDNEWQSHLATYRIEMLASEELALFAVEEHLAESPDESRTQWIRMFAAIASIARAAELLEGDPNETSLKIANLNTRTERYWTRMNTIEGPPQVSITLRLHQGMDDPSLTADLNATVAMDVADRPTLLPNLTDAFILLRSVLCAAPGGPIPRAPRSAYLAVGTLIEMGLLDFSSPSDRWMAPLISMLVLENDGLAWPYLLTCGSTRLDEVGEALKTQGPFKAVELLREMAPADDASEGPSSC